MISIVVPLYNKEKSIKATLQSVFNQTYTEWELIIVNDGSTDNSLAVVRERVKELENEKVRVISQANAGVSAARNRGILEAKGEYVAFIDADDLWASNYLETMVALICDYPNAGLYSLGYTMMYGDDMPVNIIDKESTRRGVAEHPWRMQKGVWTGSVAAAKERLVNLGMFDTRMTHGEDIDMWWRLILDGGLVEDTKCCAYYRQDSENRAMDKLIPLETHIPHFIDKYTLDRVADVEFRRFFDKQMIYRLYPYMFDKRYRGEARCIAKQLDYSLQKGSMKWRIQWPYWYRIYQKITGK